MNEHVIAIIQTDDENTRIVYTSKVTPCEKPFVLRRESFNKDVGWFTQSSIELTREEMVTLRMAMGGQTPKACQRTKMRANDTMNREPAILSFESVVKQRAARA